MFGRGVLSRHVERRLSVPVPDRAAVARSAPASASRPQGKWRSMIDRRSLTWQENVVVSWTGMRGVVTLAAAAGIPLTTVNGEPFPERATIQAIAFVVSVGTLLLQGWTLPLLIRRLHLSSRGRPRLRPRGDAQGRAASCTTPPTRCSREFRANPPRGPRPAGADRDPQHHRPALPGRRRDARPRGAHAARRGVRGALPRRAGGAACRADRGARRRPHRRRGGAGHARAPRPAGGRRVGPAGEPVLTGQ